MTNSNAHFNGLTPAEAERLALLSEECSEVIKAVAKINRHGYESSNPYDPAQDPADNRDDLMTEIGDVQAAIALMLQAGDLWPGDIDTARRDKLNRLPRWLHHQPDDLIPSCLAA